MDQEENKTTRKMQQKSTNNSINIFTIIILLISLVSLGFSAYNYTIKKNPIINYPQSNGNSATFASGSIAELVNKTSDSVVSISITTESEAQSWTGTSSPSRAAGTGFILSENGYIMTNKHVVNKAKDVNVTTNDGTVYENVKIIGLDPLNDTAILKVENPKNFKPVTLGDSKTITPGQQVIIIGNALGEYQNSVTSGIISGTGRSLTAGNSSGTSYERLTDMIQTDAAINGGNSGGPMLNAAGEVIGIATAYASSSNTIGFAIPISSVKGIIKNVLENNTYARAVLGVSYLPITPALAKEHNLPVSAGAYLNNNDNSSIFSKNSSAEKAGLKKGDIITAINGVKINKTSSLSTLVGEYKVGETVSVTVIRNSQEITINVTLDAYQK